MQSRSPSSKLKLPHLNWSLLIGSAAVLASILIAGQRQANPSWKQYAGSGQVRVLTPTLTDKPELCLTCHYGIEEISDAHAVDAFGCVSCHGGDRLSLDQEAAHAGMYGGKNPSDLAVVEQGCGGSDCHSGMPEDERDHIARVQRTVQSTYAGAINSVLFSFNQVGAEGPYYGINAVTDDQIDHPDTVADLLAFDPLAFPSEAVQAFGEQCQTCHLTAEPVNATYQYRSTGCAACHVLYNREGLYQGDDPTIPRDEPGHMARHRLTIQMPFSQCNTCHNRGNYSLAQMHFNPRTDLDPATLPANDTERRVAEYYQPIGLFTKCEWELDCIDCHTANEAMGDGDIHLNQASAQTTQCRTCHGTLTEPPEFVEITDVNDVAIRRGTLNEHYDVKVGDRVLMAPDGGTMGWVQMDGERIVQVGKVTGTWYEVPLVTGSACEQQADQQESQYCHECHAYQGDNQQ